VYAQIINIPIGQHIIKEDSLAFLRCDSDTIGFIRRNTSGEYGFPTFHSFIEVEEQGSKAEGLISIQYISVVKIVMLLQGKE